MSLKSPTVYPIIADNDKRKQIPSTRNNTGNFGEIYSRQGKDSPTEDDNSRREEDTETDQRELVTS